MSTIFSLCKGHFLFPILLHLNCVGFFLMGCIFRELLLRKSVLQKGIYEGNVNGCSLVDSSTLVLQVSSILQSGYALLDCVVENEFDLQFVFVVGVSVAEVSELFGLVKAPVKILGSHKVLRNFDAIVNVADLKQHNKFISLPHVSMGGPY